LARDALAGLRVLELGHHIAGPYCTRLLADLGAEVIKLERPGSGDPLRAWTSLPGDRPDRDGSPLFRYLNANKRSIACELNDSGGQQLARSLAKDADLVVENFRPGTLERWGLGFETLRERNPRLALVRISNFGQTGPYRDREATDLVLQAASGWVANYEAPGRDPVRVGGRMPEYVAGSFAACAALTAALAARTREEATQVDISIMECLVGTLSYPMMLLEAMKDRPPSQAGKFVLTPIGVERCADGWVSINVLTDAHWSHVCQLIDAPAFAEQRSTVAQDPAIHQSFREALTGWLEQHTAEDVVERCQGNRVPATVVATGQALLESRHFKRRPFFLEDPGGGFLRPGFPWRLGATPPRLRRPSPPLPDNVVEAAGWPKRTSSPLAPLASKAGAGSLPFSGLRVLDLGTFWAGPYMGMYLASLGADVTKVESVQRPDGFRFIAPVERRSADWYERGVLFQATNLGKRNLTLDLGQETGRGLLRRLIARSDVLIENFAPRVMERFGFDYEQVRETRADIIMLRMPAFGLEGPCRDHVGWALAIAQAAGISWITGDPGDERPRRPGAFLDPAVGMHALVALQAALSHRRRTGEGQLVELAQVEIAACMCPEPILEHSLHKRTLERAGNRSHRQAPQGVVPCDGGAWLALSVRNDAEWQRFARAIDRPDWAEDPRLAAHEGRSRHVEELDRGIAHWSAERDAAEAAQYLREHGIVAAAVLTPAGMYGEDHGHRSGTATLGQHNDEILQGELGLSRSEIEQLRAQHVIGERWLVPT
jgi:crotonobetainyl-CoA:carnitine CoA-transferase CaiB-like acyl-CoA transferase